MGLRFFTNEPLSQRFLLPSTPLSARIAARVDLEGSRGLESLPGALFFSRYMSKISETCHFLAEKNRRRQPREPQTRAGSRRQVGGGRRRRRRQAAARPLKIRRQASKNPSMSRILASSSARMPRAGRRQAGGAAARPEKAAARPEPPRRPGGRREAKIRVFPKMLPEPLGGSP